MRVVQLVDTLGSGGAQRLALDIARSGASRWSWSGLVTVSDAGVSSEHDPGDIPHLSLGSEVLTARKRVHQTLAFVAAYARLRSLVARLEIDVVQTHLPLANFLGLMLGLQGGRRVFGTVHNTREFDYGDADDRLRARLRRLAYRGIVHRCAGMIAVSAGVRDAVAVEMGLSDTEKDRISVVTNGVLPQGPPDPDRRRAWRRDRGVAEDEILIVGVGRLTDQKNLRDLVAALTLLPATTPSWRCLVAGDGPNLASLRRQIADAGLTDRVRMLGHDPQVPELLGAADIFALPSLWEGLPLACLEALGAGLPVVGYRIPGLIDVVEDGVQGLLADTGDARAFAAQLGVLVADRESRHRLGAAGYALVMKNHSFGRVLADLERVYAGRSPR